MFSMYGFGGISPDMPIRFLSTLKADSFFPLTGSYVKPHVKGVHGMV
jgi:hypothetical protein